MAAGRTNFFSLPREVRDQVYSHYLSPSQPFSLVDKRKETFTWHTSVPSLLEPIRALKSPTLEREMVELLISDRTVAFKDVAVKEIFARPSRITIGGGKKGISLVEMLDNIRHVELTLSYKQAHIIGGKVASTGSAGNILRFLPQLKSLRLCYQRWLGLTDLRLKDQLLEPLVIYEGWITSLQTVMQKLEVNVEASGRKDVQTEVFVAVQKGDLTDRVLVDVRDLLTWWEHKDKPIGEEMIKKWEQAGLKVSRGSNAIHLVWDT